MISHLSIYESTDKILMKISESKGSSCVLVRLAQLRISGTVLMAWMGSIIM